MFDSIMNMPLILNMPGFNYTKVTHDSEQNSPY